MEKVTLQNSKSNKEKYIDFCKRTPDLPIFMQFWWLNIVAGKNWNVSLVEKGNKVLGVLPFSIEKKLNFIILKNPILTPYLGPWILYNENQNRIKKLTYEKKIMTELISNLPRFDKFSSSFHLSLQNWLPFYWKNFKQTTKYTYIISKDNNAETILDSFLDKTRWEIKKAQKELILEEVTSIDSLYELVQKTYNRQKRKPPYDYLFLNKLNEKIAEKGNCKIFSARDKTNKTHTIGYFVLDKKSVYYLISGSDPQYRNSGSASLIIFEGIKFALNNGLDFNFEGSMKESIEKNFRSFGGIQTPYLKVTKNNSRLLKIKGALLD